MNSIDHSKFHIANPGTDAPTCRALQADAHYEYLLVSARTHFPQKYRCVQTVDDVFRQLGFHLPSACVDDPASYMHCLLLSCTAS